MTSPAVSARSDIATEKAARALYALLDLSKALGSEFNLDKLVEIIAEKGSAVVEAETMRVVFDEHESTDLTNCGGIVRVPILNSHGKVLGVLEAGKRSGFDAHDESLMCALAAHVAVAIERARLTELYLDQQRDEQSLRLASEIQMRMLPTGTVALPDDSPFAIHAFIRPARQIGGDLYDFFWNDESLTFCIGDVTGKGVGAALVMAMTKTLFRAYAAFQYDPARLMSAVNARLNEETDPSMFVTAFCGILNLRTGRLLYSNAGHEPPLIVRAGKAVDRLVSKSGVPLGAIRSFKYVVEKTVLAPGDAVLLFTDGVTEASNRAEELFSFHRLRDVVERHAGSEPSTIVQEVVDSVDHFADGTPQSDDIAMVCVQFRGVPEMSAVFRRDISELGNVFDLVRRFFAVSHVDDASRYPVELAAEEIFTNFVHHNVDGEDKIEVRLRLEDDELSLGMTDFGAPAFDMKHDAPLPDVSQPLEERKPGGLGVFLVKTMMDRVEYKHEDGNGTVTLYKRVR